MAKGGVSIGVVVMTLLLASSFVLSARVPIKKENHGEHSRGGNPMSFMLRQQLSKAKIDAPSLPGCCSPSQWETEAYEFNQLGGVAHKIYYDSVHKLVRWDRAGYLEKPGVYSEIITYTNYTTVPFRYEWLYYPLTGNCELYGADEFNAWCFGAPANQTFLTTLTISGQAQNAWGQDQLEGWAWVSSEDECLPTFSALGDFDTWIFYNTTQGISDPSIFIPPSVCNTTSLLGQEVRAREHRERIAGLFF